MTQVTKSLWDILPSFVKETEILIPKELCLWGKDANCPEQGSKGLKTAEGSGVGRRVWAGEESQEKCYRGRWVVFRWTRERRTFQQRKHLNPFSVLVWPSPDGQVSIYLTHPLLSPYRMRTQPVLGKYLLWGRREGRNTRKDPSAGRVAHLIDLGWRNQGKRWN